MATLINGNLNDPVYASQDSDLLAAIVGNTTSITQVGYQFAYELEDANTVMVKDGVIITKEGRRIQLDAGDVDEFLIPTGTQGVTAYYICGYHLYTDGESAELCETFVTLMSSATETIPENTFRSGATEVYVSLLRVTQNGLNISTVSNLLPSSNTIKQIMTSISAINSSITSLSTNINSTKRLTCYETLADGTDINNVSSNAVLPNSIYQISGSYSYSNLPSGVLYGILETIDASSFLFQRLTNYNNIYIRFYANSSWQSWNLLNNSSDVLSAITNNALLYKGQLASGSNINDIKANTIYAINGAYTYTNIPDGLKYGILETEFAADFGSQRFVLPGKIYVRFYANRAWGNWQKLNCSLDQDSGAVFLKSNMTSSYREIVGGELSGNPLLRTTEWSSGSMNKSLEISFDGTDFYATGKKAGRKKVLIGTYSTDSTVNVSAYSTSAGDFLAVCDTSNTDTITKVWGGSGSLQTSASSTATFTPPSISISGNTLTIVCGKLTVSNNYSMSDTKRLVTKLYYAP